MIVFFEVVPAPLPPSVKFVELPLICAAIASAASLRAQDWAALCSRGPQQAPTAGTGVVAFIGGAVSAYLVSITSLGKVVLNALDQNVVGTLPSEMTEIRLVGGALGFFVGAFATSLIWTLVFRGRLPRKPD